MPDRSRLGLRARLAAFFVVMTVLPVLGAILALHGQVEDRLTTRTESELVSVREAVVALVQGSRLRAGDLASDLATALAAEPVAAALDTPAAVAAVEDFLAERAAAGVPDRADVVVIAGPDAQPVASLSRPQVRPASLPGASPGPEDFARAAAEDVPVPGALLEVRELLGANNVTLGWVVTALWTDEQLLASAGLTGRAALVQDGTVLGMTAGSAGEEVPTDRPTEPAEVSSSGAEGALVTAAPLGRPGAGDPPVELVIWAPREVQPSAIAVALPLVLPAMVLAALLGLVLAATVAAPILRAAEVARAVAAGDLTHHLEPGGGRELSELSEAMDQMTTVLTTRVKDMEERERQFRASLARLGQTLSSSLDLNRTLSVVVDTVRDAVGADRALLSLLTPERDALYTKVGRGFDGPVRALRLGEGLIGTVAEQGLPVLIPGPMLVPDHAPGEPRGSSQLAVPLLVRGRVLGVLTLLRDLPDPDSVFDELDLENLRSFATQASVAIENVLLHREAQRLAVTDPLTGLWNYRYLQIQADRQLKAAERSGRPMSLIVVDIDHFKLINDRFGHQVGDDVLIEVARRLRDSTRFPDTVARYGGEEFIVLLPDTDLRGAVVMGERVRSAVAADVFRPAGASATASTGLPALAPLEVTCSVGAATFPAHGATVAALLRAADTAMYEAKRQGRNRVARAGG